MVKTQELADIDLLRFSTAGSVDDGKSTLIGRLLYDSKSILEDQYQAITRASEKKGLEDVDLALLTDGLRAEREQGITIDVAYRYFSTARRKFIIADTPGHEQYTRNMVTGASTADLAIILVDARNGVVTQSRRHAFLSSLLQVPHLLVVVNKMDLVDYKEERYREILAEFRPFSDKLAIRDLNFIPASALKGDNIVHKSDKMGWYDGPTLLHYLEETHVASSHNLVDFRFPVQTVIRPHQDFRGFAGRVSSGTIRPGEEVVVLPSGRESKVSGIVTYDGDLPEAAAGDSVTLTLEHEVDVSRGDMIVRKKNLPVGTEEFEATVSWMNDEALQVDKPYILQHTTRRVRAVISELAYRIDVNTLHRENAQRLELNDIGRVKILTSERIFFDSYALNRATGSFILIDPDSLNTVGAGMILRRARTLSRVAPSPTADLQRLQSADTTKQVGAVSLSDREGQQKNRAAVVWFTGLSGSGKTTIAHAAEKRLFEMGVRTTSLDGDNLRQGLCGDLGFLPEDRKENVRRAAETARLMFDTGQVVLCTLISPFRNDRTFARSLIPADRFFEVYVDTDIEECRKRDPKGLYARADKGLITTFTGVSSPYEQPTKPELVISTAGQSVEQSVNALVEFLKSKYVI